MRKITMVLSLSLVMAVGLWSCHSAGSGDKAQTSAGNAATASLPDGEKVFDRHCAVCHIKTLPDKENIKTLAAPPITGVGFHIKRHFTGDDGRFRREEAAKFIIDYVEFPAEVKALCMPKTIKRFGVMPSQKGSLTPQELSAVAGYILDNYPLKDFHHPDNEGDSLQ